MNNKLWAVAVIAGLVTTGCGHNRSSSTTSPGSPGSPGAAASPMEFASFVNQQLKEQPAFGVVPASTASLTGDFALDGPSPFASVGFGSGDALPAGTYQAVVACSDAGTMACNPAVSADLNSTLN